MYAAPGTAVYAAHGTEQNNHASPHTYREANRQRPADIQTDRKTDQHTHVYSCWRKGSWWSISGLGTKYLVHQDNNYHRSLVCNPFTTVASLGHRCSAVCKREATFDTLEHNIKRQMKYYRNNNATDTKPIETLDCRPLPQCSHYVLRAPCNNNKHILRSLQVSSAKGIFLWK